MGVRASGPRWVRAGLVALVAAVGSAQAIDAPKPIAGRTLVVTIDGEIDLGLAPFALRVLEDATADDLIIFEINTFGGRIDAAVLIRDAILRSNAKTVAFVNKRAISAGALIALAADTIVMASGATIGAATPVQLEGGKMAPVEAKVVSYMRKEMKATAEAKKRRGDVAEAMVDAAVEIADLGDDDEATVTLTTDEALKVKYAAFSVDTLAEVCKRLDRPEPTTIRPALNWAERIARFLSSPAVSSLLMSLGMLGIMIELWSPGHAIAGVVGVVCLALFFFGHYVVHLAGWGEILLFVFGLSALLIELIFWPGHGVVAVLGVLAILAALMLALLDVKTLPFEVSLSLGLVTRALARVMGSVLLTAFAMALVTRLLPNTRFGRKLILDAAITATATDEHAGAQVQVGARGVAETPLHPTGKMKLDGRRHDVVSEGEQVDAGAAIEVVSVDGARIVVKRRPIA
ncbi:MAG: nodulation protein NfeD [Myxococcales bacterium]|nr:nodulation protein NfeD [Myxococcales bacterium]